MHPPGMIVQRTMDLPNVQGVEQAIGGGCSCQIASRADVQEAEANAGQVTEADRSSRLVRVGVVSVLGFLPPPSLTLFSLTPLTTPSLAGNTSPHSHVSLMVVVVGVVAETSVQRFSPKLADVSFNQFTNGPVAGAHCVRTCRGYLPKLLPLRDRRWVHRGWGCELCSRGLIVSPLYLLHKGMVWAHAICVEDFSVVPRDPSSDESDSEIGMAPRPATRSRIQDARPAPLRTMLMFRLATRPMATSGSQQPCWRRLCAEPTARQVGRSHAQSIATCAAETHTMTTLRRPKS
ncbi:uncharacterized protein K452DRAFT_96643 [Aplosporella prunicola CBS 121167]|uniref:Uncharacterized protein n=1 Tax=Aplosporella prunicola CBS 121167 TaxID=1176127 RepID=A0A6A6B3V1_9PEZI|nr:uncharacterized protein K452DRAFT_96643 [Aplosporella prunicola CBS 121167]KAF2137894.1 hypothetical protein K452DRAFT_96643 [Aplosporella prunicola CBS 121167]